MTDGLHEVNVANAMLNTLRNVAFQIAATRVELYIGDPGWVTMRWVPPLRQSLEPRYMSGIVWLRYVSHLATGLFGSAMRACISGSAMMASWSFP